jgi:CBS domain-containing protein
MQPGTAGQTQRRTPAFQSVAIEEVIQTDVVTVSEDTEVADIVESMADHNVGSVVVVDDEDTPKGLITDRRLALSLAESPDITDRLAREFTQDELVTGPTEMTVYDAINELSQESIRRLPVVDDDGTLVGIVTLDDILVLLSMELETAADIIEAQSPGL